MKDEEEGKDSAALLEGPGDGGGVVKKRTTFLMKFKDRTRGV